MFVFKLGKDELDFNHHRGQYVPHEYKVCFSHVDTSNLNVVGKRRGTVCKIFVDGVPFCSDMAICAESDNFNKATGRKIALKRAISNLPRKTRAKFWAAYFENHKR